MVKSYLTHMSVKSIKPLHTYFGLHFHASFHKLANLRFTFEKFLMHLKGSKSMYFILLWWAIKFHFSMM